jgi:hypothetical protein
MRRKILLVLMLLLVGCGSGGEQIADEGYELPAPGVRTYTEETQLKTSPTPDPQAAPTLTNLGQAPELTNDVWLNSAEPLRLADLRGEVVLIEMWTFG